MCSITLIATVSKQRLLLRLHQLFLHLLPHLLHLHQWFMHLHPHRYRVLLWCQASASK